jgi:hypothetical protein
LSILIFISWFRIILLFIWINFLELHLLTRPFVSLFFELYIFTLYCWHLTDVIIDNRACTTQWLLELLNILVVSCWLWKIFVMLRVLLCLIQSTEIWCSLCRRRHLVNADRLWWLIYTVTLNVIHPRATARFYFWLDILVWFKMGLSYCLFRITISVHISLGF